MVNSWVPSQSWPCLSLISCAPSYPHPFQKGTPSPASSIHVLPVPPELPVHFSRPLQDVVAAEKDKVTLECELSRPNVTVHWLKVPLTSGIPLS